MSVAHGSRRVLVTGIGMVSPLGQGTTENWKAVVDGAHCITKVPEFSTNCKLAGRLTTRIFNPEDHLTSLNEPIYSLGSAIIAQTLRDAAWKEAQLNERELRKTGILVANQYGVQEVGKDKEAGKLRLIKEMNHIVPAQAAMAYGFKGHVGMTTMASAGGGIAIGEAFRLIKHGYMDRMVVGGFDYNVNENVMEGMDAFKALTRTQNDTPDEAMRPFDKKRSGTVLSDGGACLFLETEESAERRGVSQVYGEVAGYHMTCDAYHVLRPTDSGIGLISAIQEALIEAGVAPQHVSAFNCHATSTPVGDKSEASCIASILGAAHQRNVKTLDDFKAISPEEISQYTASDIGTEDLPVLTALKGNLGHCVAGAGSLEAAFALLSLQKQEVTKIRNLEDPLCDKLRFATRNEHQALDVIVKNSLVFGGINASMVFKRFV